MLKVDNISLYYGAAQAGHPVRRVVYWFAPSVAAAYWIVRLRGR